MSDSRDAVVFPDYLGQEAKCGRLEREIHAVLPEATIIAAVNGTDRVTASEEVEVIYTRAGFNHAVLEGLQRALELGAKRVVRIDANKHDVRLIPTALGELEAADVVVMDASFNSREIEIGSAEDYHTRYVIPELVLHATRGRLALSGSHGFMAFRAEALGPLLEVVTRLVDVAESEAQTQRAGAVTWSADTMLAIVAAREDLRVNVRMVPAGYVRCNPLGKSVRQLRDLITLTRILDDDTKIS